MRVEEWMGGLTKRVGGTEGAKCGVITEGRKHDWLGGRQEGKSVGKGFAGGLKSERALSIDDVAAGCRGEGPADAGGRDAGTADTVVGGTKSCKPEAITNEIHNDRLRLVPTR